MDNVALQNTLSGLQAQINEQRAQYTALQQEHQQLLRDSKNRTTLLESKQAPWELHQQLSDAIAPHLQLEPMPQSDRKRLLAEYPQLDLPKAIKDDNGFGARAIASADNRKWLLTHVPQLQRDGLDLLRMSAAAWQRALCTEDPQLRGAQLLDALRDITTVAADNVQRLAQLQLKQTFETSGAKGAHSILDLGPETQDINFKDTNLLQHAHIEAMQELQQYNKSIDTAKQANKGKSGRGNQRFGNRNRGGGKGGYRGNRGGGRGSYNNNRNNYQAKNWRSKQDDQKDP